MSNKTLVRETFGFWVLYMFKVWKKPALYPHTKPFYFLTNGFFIWGFARGWEKDVTWIFHLLEYVDALVKPQIKNPLVRK